MLAHTNDAVPKSCALSVNGTIEPFVLTVVTFVSPKVTSLVAVADDGCALRPIVVRFDPVVIVQPDAFPIVVLQEPVVVKNWENKPTAVLSLPVVFLHKLL